ILVKSRLQRRGVNADVEVFSPQPMTLPILGQAACDDFEVELAAKDVTFLPNYKATAVEAGEVIFPAERRPFDLLLAVPPHQCPPVIQQRGLTAGSEWVHVNRRTMETQFAGVYAIGDVVEIQMANGKPLPKAGVFAEAMGHVAAEHIAASFA